MIVRLIFLCSFWGTCAILQTIHFASVSYVFFTPVLGPLITRAFSAGHAFIQHQPHLDMSHNTSTCSPPVRTHHPSHSTCNSTLSTSPNPVESPVQLYSNMPSLPPKNSLHQSANACHPHPNASSSLGVLTHNHSSPPHAAFKGVEGFKPPLFVLTRAWVPLH